MFLVIAAFVAGILTILAPCVLPLLPVIIGGSVSGNTTDRRRPVVIASSLAVSLLLFTVVLKATTILIRVPPMVITYVSGGLVIVLGISMFFPGLYARAVASSGIEHGSQKLLSKGANNRKPMLGSLLTGAALGPVFSSCSPVYAYIVATVLPAHFGQAMIYIVAYIIGLALVLLAIGFYGQHVVSRLKIASNPTGLFQRTIAVLFVLIGVLIITGSTTKIQTYAAAHTPYQFDTLSAKLLPTNDSGGQKNSGLYNVTAYKAPELTGIESWINSQPLTLAQLKGKVVLIDFWTYSCINCIHTLPYVQSWYSKYKDQGLVVIGVHAPESSFEKVPANVAQAVKSDGLTYPIALDSDLLTWTAFENEYWPAQYLIDRQGNVVRQYFGEGEYKQSENAIRGLLSQKS